MASWRAAKSLLTLRDQVNTIWPGRDKSSDGLIGDIRHQATKSDHNPNRYGVVTALDITHDPAHGLDARKLAETLVASKDRRIKYIISNAQIISSQVSPWQWRPYSGSNAHRHHVHISVDGDPKLFDDPRPWAIGAVIEPPPPGNLLFRVRGKMSTFGGPFDTGMAPDEGLALFTSAGEMVEHGISVLPAGGGLTGLGRRLNPDTYYLACRWDYSKTSKKFLQSAKATVAANGRSIMARPVDWGPNERTGRVTDLSPALARDLGLHTDDICEVTIKGDGQ